MSARSSGSNDGGMVRWEPQVMATPAAVADNDLPMIPDLDLDFDGTVARCARRTCRRS